MGAAWTTTEVATLVRLNRAANGDCRVLITMARGVINRTEKAIRLKRTELKLMRKKPKSARPPLLPPEQLSPAIPIRLAPPRCPSCGGAWWLDEDVINDLADLVCYNGCKRIPVIAPRRRGERN